MTFHITNPAIPARPPVPPSLRARTTGYGLAWKARAMNRGARRNARKQAEIARMERAAERLGGVREEAA